MSHISWWEDHCSQAVNGLHAVSSVLPFNVFSFAGSARDSCTEWGCTRPGEKTKFRFPERKGGMGCLEIGGLPKQFPASGF